MPSYSTIFLAFVSIFICVLLIEEPNVNRSNALYIPSLFLVCIALRFFYQKSKILFGGIAIAYACFFIAFISFYYNEYPIKYHHLPFFENQMMEVIPYLELEKHYTEKCPKLNIDYKAKYFVR